MRSGSSLQTPEVAKSIIATQRPIWSFGTLERFGPSTLCNILGGSTTTMTPRDQPSGTIHAHWRGRAAHSHTMVVRKCVSWLKWLDACQCRFHDAVIMELPNDQGVSGSGGYSMAHRIPRPQSSVGDSCMQWMGNEGPDHVADVE